MKAATENETDWAEKIGKPTFDAIAEMVAALKCDYDRLAELRDERESLVNERDTARPRIKAHREAATALSAWDE